MNNFYNALVSHAVTGSAQSEVWLNYALGTNDRGKDVLRTLSNFMTDFKHKKHLDIGCGYAGTCIALSEAGAISTGIDVDTELIKLALLNIQDHEALDIKVLHMDFMDQEQIHNLDCYDIITCDNVIEHVASAEILINNIDFVLNKNGLVYLTIPNAWSLGQIRKDCHYGLFGISLLDPWDAAIYLRSITDYTSYDVSFFHPFSIYEYYFKKYGFQYSILNPYSVSENEMLDLLSQYKSLRKEWYDLDLKIPEEIKQKIDKLINHHIRVIDTNIIHYQQMNNTQQKYIFGAQILRNYQTELWYVVLKRESTLGSFRAFLKRFSK